MSLLLSIVVCAVLHSIKGGQHGPVFKNDLVRAAQNFDHRLGIAADIIFDGKILSSVGFGLLILFLSVDYQGFQHGGPVYHFAEGTGLTAALSAVAWLAGVSPKMGRIAGSIGGYRGNWDENEMPYAGTERKARAIEGWKAGLQRGVFMGACLTLILNNPALIIAGATFPAAYWLGISIQQFITKKYAADWHWSEVIYGGLIGAGLEYQF